MTTIPQTIMEEARRLLREGNCVACIDDMHCSCIEPLCESLIAAEQRGAERERERCTSAAKSLAAGFAVKAQNPSIGEDEARLLAIHADAFTDFAQMRAAIRNTKE